VVMIEKHCSEHGVFQEFLENHQEFYRQHMFRRGLDRPIPVEAYIMPVSNRCNIQCRFCYFPEEEKPELTVNQIVEKCRPLDGSIVLAGAEPTLRRDLPELISRLKEIGKSVLLLTNGIRLANADYVAKLKLAGLDRVILSISSLRASFYEEMEGHRFLGRKLAALENLSSEGLQTNISATITRGINDDELGALWQLCLDHASTVNAFRVRSSANVGRGIDLPRLHLSELTDLLAKAVGVDNSVLRDGYDQDNNYRSAISVKTVAHLRWEKGMAKLADIDPAPFWNRTTGTFTTSPEMAKEKDAIVLHLVSWPDSTNIDLDEKCSLAYATEDSGILPFFEALVRGEDDVQL